MKCHAKCFCVKVDDHESPISLMDSKDRGIREGFSLLVNEISSVRSTECKITESPLPERQGPFA